MNTVKYIEKINFIIGDYILPFGFFLFLTGMLFLSSMSAYHTQIYLFLIAPALFYIVTNLSEFQPLLKSRIFQILLIFFSYATLSLLWNDSDINDFKPIKQLFIILLFVLSLIIIHQKNSDKIINIFLIAAVIYSCAAYYSFYTEGVEHRIVGIGNLSNTLLSSHIYGIFTVFIMAYFFASKRNWKKDIALIALFFSLLSFVHLTQSRTPLLGIAASSLLIFWMHQSKQTFYIFLVLCIASIIYFSINYEQFSGRGLSYRPELWSLSFDLIKQNLFFGVGLGKEINLYLVPLETMFSDTHNIYVGITYKLGILGLIIWLIFLVSLLFVYLKNKSLFVAKIGIVLLAYGVAAGMTEGTNFLTRPKEVWFLTWLPISLILLSEINYSPSKSNEILSIHQ